MIKYRVSCVLGQSLQGSFNTGTSVTNSEFSIKDSLCLGSVLMNNMVRLLP